MTENEGLRYPHLPETHIANVQVGDKINTPMGIETVYWCSDHRFTTYKMELGMITRVGHFGFVPYFESRNEEKFNIIK